MSSKNTIKHAFLNSHSFIILVSNENFIDQKRKYLCTPILVSNENFIDQKRKYLCTPGVYSGSRTNKISSLFKLQCSSISRKLKHGRG